MNDKTAYDVEMLVKNHIIIKQAVWLFVIFAISVKPQIKNEKFREKFSTELKKLISVMEVIQ